MLHGNDGSAIANIGTCIRVFRQNACRISWQRASVSRYERLLIHMEHLSTILTHRHRVTRSYSVTTSPDQGRDVAILGGGISGLTAAYYLSQSQPSTKITIYEAAPRIGGWLSSKKVTAMDGSDILFEAGPRSLRPAGNGLLAARLV